MLFIDWISAPHHRNFNRSFFAAIKHTGATCHVFSPILSIPEVECRVHAFGASRWRQAIAVLRLLWMHRSQNILLLTYDPLFLPVAKLLNRSMIVFEHNTTPEEGLSKRFVWQKLLFGRIHRIAQFQGQASQLQRMGSRVSYLGSPLLQPARRTRTSASPSDAPLVFLAPSYRAALGELDQFAQCFEGSTIVVKRFAADACKGGVPDSLRIEPVDWIEVESGGRTVDGVIITVQSRVRGTGWFNEAIAHGIPVITTNANASQLFQETFPDYPFVDMMRVRDVGHFKSLLEQVRAVESAAYVERHNEALRLRFRELCRERGMPCGPG